MKPRWYGFCYTCRESVLCQTRRKLRDWKGQHARGLEHRVMLYVIQKWGVVF